MSDKCIGRGVDFKGQQLSEIMSQVIIIVSSIVAFVVGYQKESFWVTFYGWSIGTTAAMLLCCPDWCWFSRNPVEWLAPFGKEKISPTPKAGGVIEANEAKPKPKPKPKPKQKKKEKENAQPDTKEE